MQPVKTSFLDIFFSLDHLAAPYTYQREVKAGLIEQKKLSTAIKATTIALAVLLAVPTLLIGSALILYTITAIAKYRKQSQGDTVKKVYAVSTHAFDPNPLVDNQTAFQRIPPELLGDLRPVPAHMNVRIDNLGNTCWLNSFLKFLAQDDAFDRVLQVSDDEIRNMPRQGRDAEDWESYAQKLILLRDNLKFIVNILRDASPGKTFIDPRYVASLLELIHSFDAGLGYNQCDAAEALNAVLGLFDLLRNAEGHTAQVTEAYYNEAGALKAAQTVDMPIIQATAINPDIRTADGRAIDLDKCVNPGQESRSLEDDEGVMADFLCHVAMTNAPDQLTINLGRLNWDGRKDTTPIAMNGNCRVKINSYSENNPGQLDVNAEITYQITGAIVHSGTGKNGHYIFIKKEGERFFCHNDSDLVELNIDVARRMISRATTIRLQKHNP